MSAAFPAFLLKHSAISHQFTLKKHQRIKSRKLIEKIFKSGKSFNEYPFRIIVSDGNRPNLQLGVSVSKRRFKKSVDRNRIKRLMREAWRLNAVPLRQQLEKNAISLAVFIVYNGNEIPTFSEVETKMKLILKKLEEKYAGNTQGKSKE